MASLPPLSQRPAHPPSVSRGPLYPASPRPGSTLKGRSSGEYVEAVWVREACSHLTSHLSQKQQGKPSQPQRPARPPPTPAQAGCDLIFSLSFREESTSTTAKNRDRGPYPTASRPPPAARRTPPGGGAPEGREGADGAGIGAGRGGAVGVMAPVVAAAAAASAAGTEVAAAAAASRVAGRPCAGSAGTRSHGGLHRDLGRQRLRELRGDPDRKSTRLNSSH